MWKFTNKYVSNNPHGEISKFSCNTTDGTSWTAYKEQNVEKEWNKQEGQFLVRCQFYLSGISEGVKWDLNTYLEN